MFETLRKRVVSATGMQVCAFEDIEHLDVDSMDSICLSDVSSYKSSHSVRSVSSTQSLSSVEDLAKSKVLKMVRTIKKLEARQIAKKESKMPMLEFMDLIRDQQYNHVSMSLLTKFMKTCKMVPKNYYLHYYIFFLHYASFYHYTRSTVDIIDDKMNKQHKYHLICIKHQLKYLQHIINESRLRDITL